MSVSVLRWWCSMADANSPLDGIDTFCRVAFGAFVVLSNSRVLREVRVRKNPKTAEMHVGCSCRAKNL